MRFSEEKYHCLIAGLPELAPDIKKVSLGLKELRDQLQESLTPVDNELSNRLFAFYDVQNLLCLMEGNDDFSELGIIGKEEMQDIITSKDLRDDIVLPSSLKEVFERYIAARKSEKDIYPGLLWEDQLMTLFFDYMLRSDHPFLKIWFDLEMNLRNLVAAINARRFETIIDKAVIGNNEFAMYLRSSKQKDFGLSGEYPWVEKVVALFEQDDILKREKEIDLVRWGLLEDITRFNYFSLEIVISYIVRLQIVERWLRLNEDAGREMFNKLFEELESSYEIPNEFKI
jgi:hypothetical protein